MATAGICSYCGKHSEMVVPRYDRSKVICMPCRDRHKKRMDKALRFGETYGSTRPLTQLMNMPETREFKDILAEEIAKEN